MSAIETKQVWSSITSDNLDSKYEKCRNITEEIYKRINITFQIKKLETGTQSDSDQSDVLDSNELSNETDLFACDKSSISSSTDPDGRTDKFVNINNNEELAREKKPVACKRPRKRFRKRVKKRQPAAERSDSDASSDSALPLSRMVTVDSARPGDPRDVMGVPNIIIITKDFKPRIKTPDKKPSRHDSEKMPEASKQAADKTQTINKKTTDKTIDKEAAMLDSKEKGADLDLKSCTMCSLSFRGDRGLRRHMNMTHVIPDVKSERRGTPA